MGLFYTWYYAGMTLLPSVAGWLQDAMGGAAAIECAAAAIAVALMSYLAFRAVAGRAGAPHPDRITPPSRTAAPPAARTA
jgi:hypothetical protein